MKWIVTMELWRETWNGNDQFDGISQVEVMAATEERACRKGKLKALNPGKGKSWSHSLWAKNVTARVKEQA